jgi:hypothetical protein
VAGVSTGDLSRHFNKLSAARGAQKLRGEFIASRNRAGTLVTALAESRVDMPAALAGLSAKLSFEELADEESLRLERDGGGCQSILTSSTRIMMCGRRSSRHSFGATAEGDEALTLGPQSAVRPIATWKCQRLLMSSPTDFVMVRNYGSFRLITPLNVLARRRGSAEGMRLAIKAAIFDG